LCRRTHGSEKQNRVSTETVTLIAAATAAAASLVSLLLNAYLARQSEFRTVHRSVLVPVTPRLGQALHEALAASTVLIRHVPEGQHRKNWISTGDRAGDDLKALRLEVRYPLWGVEEALQLLGRFPDWAQNYPLRNGSDGMELLARGNALRAMVDEIVMKSYAKGRPPVWRERRRLAKLVEETQAIRDRDFSQGEPANAEPGSLDRID
jgi:hypothetical protein